MFHSHYTHITTWLHMHPHWGWLAAFIIAFSESLAVIGSIIPGSVTMTAIGILAGSGVLPIWSIIISAIFGAILGDGISYIGGYYLQDKTRRIWPFTRFPQILLKGEVFFVKHGGKSVFFGRFVGPVRAIVPLVAGSLKFPPKRYFSASILSAIAWAPAYMLPGILLGAVSLEMPARVATELILIVLLILIAIWIVAWLTKQIFRRTRRYFNSILDVKWDRWLTKPSKRWICTILQNGEHPETHGQLLIFIVAIALGALFLLTFANVIFHGPLLHWNNLVYHWFRGLRSPTIDHIAIVVTSLGNKTVLLPLFFTLFIWLLLIKRFRAAIHWFFLCVLSSGAVYFFKHIYFSHRPFGILSNPTTSSFPSGHTTLSLTLYGFIAFLLAYQQSKTFRKVTYRIIFALCLMIAISRMYLGAHWLSDIIGATMLSLSILYFVIISYRRIRTRKLPVMGIIVVTILTLSISDGHYLYHHFQTDIINSQPYWKTINVQKQSWWTKTPKLVPYYRKDRLGKPAEILNIQWAGSLSNIKATLINHGWQNVLDRGYLSTLKKIAQEERKLPHTFFAKLYRDQHSSAEFVKYTQASSVPLVLRIWSAKVNIIPGNKPLWVGTIYFDPMVKELIPFLNRKKHTFIPADKLVISYLIPSLGGYIWETKAISAKDIPKQLRKTNPLAKVILIRSRRLH